MIKPVPAKHLNNLLKLQWSLAEIIGKPVARFPFAEGNNGDIGISIEGTEWYAILNGMCTGEDRSDYDRLTADLETNGLYLEPINGWLLAAYPLPTMREKVLCCGEGARVKGPSGFIFTYEDGAWTQPNFSVSYPPEQFSAIVDETWSFLPWE